MGYRSTLMADLLPIEVARTALLDRAADVEALHDRLVRAGPQLSEDDVQEIYDDLCEQQHWRAASALLWYSAELCAAVEDADLDRYDAARIALLADEAGQARRLIEEMIERSTHPEKHAVHAEILFVLGLPALSAQAAERAVRLDAGFAEGWFFWGRALRAMKGRDLEVVEAFEKAHALVPSEDRYFIELAGSVANLEIHGLSYARYDAVKRGLRPIAARGEDFWATIYWAQMLWLDDEIAECEATLRFATRRWPSESLPYSLLGYYLSNWNRPAAEQDQWIEDFAAARDLQAEEAERAVFDAAITRLVALRRARAGATRS